MLVSPPDRTPHETVSLAPKWAGPCLGPLLMFAIFLTVKIGAQTLVSQAHIDQYDPEHSLSRSFYFIASRAIRAQRKAGNVKRNIYF